MQWLDRNRKEALMKHVGNAYGRVASLLRQYIRPLGMLSGARRWPAGSSATCNARSHT